jgi:release factor glutamine methyltransferase
MATRTPYEQTQLAKYGVKNQNLLNISEAPIEYITQICEASDQIFKVTPHTLIPRIETEQLVEMAVTSAIVQIKSNPKLKTYRVLDVGTGSGYIGIMIAKKLATLYPNISIELVLSDLSKKALLVAKANAKTILQPSAPNSTTSTKLKVKLVQSNLLANIKLNPFHLITANLPYLPKNRLRTLQPSVRNFEPALALDGGHSGFEIIFQLLIQVPAYLKPTASLFLEVDHTHTPDFFNEYDKKSKKSFNFNRDHFNFFLDQFGQNRFVQYCPNKKIPN